MTSNDYKETFTFMYTNTEGDVLMRSFTSDGVNLNDIGEAFYSFLLGCTFTAVSGVAIETHNGMTFGSE